MKNFKFPKWVVVIVAAAVYLPLVVDWIAPGDGARLSCLVLRASCGGETPPPHALQFPLWGWLVGLAGKDVAALGAISVGAGLVCVWLVVAIVGAIFGAAVRGAKAGGIKGEEGQYDWVESAAILIAGLGFALTPGFLVAATRVSPLMVALVPPLAAAALVVGVCWGQRGADAASTLVGRMKKGKGRLLLAVGLVGYSAFELVLARRVFLPMILPALGVWLAVGVMPALVIAWCVWKRWLVGRKAIWGSLGGWALGVVVMGVVAFISGWMNEGRSANRLVARIIANLRDQGSGMRDEGKIAIVSDGMLDDLFFFMLPEKVKLISLARERDPAYGRELSDWVRGIGTQLPSANANSAKTDVATTARNTAPTPQSVFAKVDAPTNEATLAFSDSMHRSGAEGTSPKATRRVRKRVRVATEGSVVAGSENTKSAYRASDLRSKIEDLAFAAELGPGALIDEWAKIDKAGFEAAVASVVNFFPTREKWDEACGDLDGMRADEPLAKYLRHLLGVCGNALGCRMLEEGERRKEKGESAERDAWAVFKKIVDEVEPANYGAFLNLLGMVQRGYDVPKDEVNDLTKRRQQIEKGLKSWDRILAAARSGGRIYADPDSLARYEKAKAEMAAKRELSPEQKAFVETVAAAPQDAERGRAAQEVMHKAIREGKVRADAVGVHLITIDLALGDTENAEKDAIDVLKIDRHDPAANAALGSLAVGRGEYKRAEQYLRRAIATGKASGGAKNDLAWALYRLGRLDEAEPFAREAVAVLGESWACRETLAAILIRQGKIEEGERELAKAEELLAKAGIPKKTVVSIEIDRARILKAKGDNDYFKIKIKSLKNRKDLTDEQREEVKGMDW